MLRMICLSLVLVAGVVTPALAHTTVGTSHTLAAGIAHPLSGTDHILTMVAVGLWAALVGGRALWSWPAAFVAAMVVGFAVASCGISLPLVEPAVGLSAIFIGLLVAFAARAPVWLGAVIVGIFAFFHGHAHGTEAAAGSLVAYAVGFALATAALHAAGIGLGRVVERSASRLAVRALGAFAVLGAIATVAG